MRTTIIDQDISLAEDKRLIKLGTAFAKKTGIRTAEDVAEMVHKHRKIKKEVKIKDSGRWIK